MRPEIDRFRDRDAFPHRSFRRRPGDRPRNPDRAALGRRDPRRGSRSQSGPRVLARRQCAVPKARDCAPPGEPRGPGAAQPAPGVAEAVDALPRSRQRFVDAPAGAPENPLTSQVTQHETDTTDNARAMLGRRFRPVPDVRRRRPDLEHGGQARHPGEPRRPGGCLPAATSPASGSVRHRQDRRDAVDGQASPWELLTTWRQEQVLGKPLTAQADVYAFGIHTPNQPPTTTKQTNNSPCFLPYISFPVRPEMHTQRASPPLKIQRRQTSTQRHTYKLINSSLDPNSRSTVPQHINSTSPKKVSTYQGT